MNFEEFGTVFGVMCEYFEAIPSEGLTQIYFEDLKGISIENFKKAFQILRATRVYKGLPKIAEITEAIDGKPEDQAAIAYQTLIKAMKEIGPWDTIIFEDGAIGKTIEALGGWEMINEWTIDEWKFRKRDFDQLYLANLRYGRIEPVKLLGTFDRINGLTGNQGENIPVLVTKEMKFIAIEEIRKIEDKKTAFKKNI